VRLRSGHATHRLGTEVRWLAIWLWLLETIFSYIESADPRPMVHVDEEIVRAARRLLDFPESGRPGWIARTRELVIPRTPCIAAFRFRGSCSSNPFTSGFLSMVHSGGIEFSFVVGSTVWAHSNYRPVLGPIQPHIRSPLSAAAPLSRFRRARAQENGAKLKVGG